MSDVFEQYKADFLLERMLSRVPDSIDKREGSVIYDALSPSAVEMDILYQELAFVLKNAFATTADRLGLERIAAAVGMTIYPATPAVVKAEFNLQIPIGSKFYIEQVEFTARSFIEDSQSKFYYELVCDRSGTVGNIPSGKLLPSQTIEGLQSALIVSIIERGHEEEELEHLRERYLTRMREPATSGNIYHYKKWAFEVPGVGAVKVFPLASGPGTVKLVFVNDKFQAPGKELIEAVKTHVDANRPIGATVEVVGATNNSISVSVKAKTLQGTTLSNIQNEFSSTLKEYFKNISFKADYVSIAKVGNVLLNIPGVLDYQELKLNSSMDNVVLSVEEIPVLSSVSVEVMK